MFLHVNYISSGDIIKEYELDNEYREFCVVDNYLIISNTEEIVKIDINTGKVVGEIEALKDYAGGRTSIFSSKEDIIYLVNKSGMYSYSIKNDTITEVISGDNASIGTEKYALDIFLPKNNNEFLALYYEPEKDENKYSLKNYYYSEGGNENGENEITVYSVYKNEALSEAISLYNVKNPKTTIKYEVGVSGDNAVTESDALRVLNTEIIAGNGPTVIVLDDIPIDNYINKVCDIFIFTGDNYPKVEFGTVNSLQDISFMKGITENKLSYKIGYGDNEGSFVPGLILGINSKGRNKEIAEKFIIESLSSAVQENNSKETFPISKDALNKEQGQLTIMPIMFERPNGTVADFTSKEIDKEEFESIKGTISKASKPTYNNRVILEKIIDEAEEYITGEITLDEAINKIKNKLKVYLSE